MRIERCYTKAGQDAYSEIELRKATSEIKNPDGSVVIHTGLFEQGTGTYTTLRQITAEELSLNPDEIQIDILDTDSSAPFDSGDRKSVV